ncbi:MAG: hypothetical protein COB53_08785 [Elusimicrobia bacterium]|nr:MAG: hypothetical protein COB53_08785 [Elusimicrobiota bacterium]
MNLKSGLIILAGVFMGCAAPMPKGSYKYQQESLSATSVEKVGRLEAGSEAEKEAIARWKNVFADFTAEALKKTVRASYAKDAWFYDTLKIVRGVDAIEHYLVDSANGVVSCKVEIQDGWRSGDEHYFRWEMHIVFKKFRKGEVNSSVGISHVRFDKNGMVVMHHDYWDAADGLFEKVPIFGWGIRRIKARL